MPIYRPITEVMPVGSMVTGAAVTAGLCDQIRDNLVALYDGWWFRATRTTTAGPIPATTVTPIPMDTLAMARSAVDDGSIAFVGNGVVSLRKAGVWKLGWQFAMSAYVGLVDALITATDQVGGAVCERLVDANAVTSDVSLCGSLNATTIPQLVTPNIYAGSTLSVGAPRMLFWGVWVGDNP